MLNQSIARGTKSTESTARRARKHNTSRLHLRVADEHLFSLVGLFLDKLLHVRHDVPNLVGAHLHHDSFYGALLQDVIVHVVNSLNYWKRVL